MVVLDARILQYDASSAEVLTKDKKTMVVDNFAKWRIVDPLQFFRTLTTISRAQSRLDDLVYAEVRVAIGNYSLDEVVSAKRSEIMSIVTYNVNETVKNMGIQILDVRIKRTDLPPQNEKAIFAACGPSASARPSSTVPRARRRRPRSSPRRKRSAP